MGRAGRVTGAQKRRVRAALLSIEGVVESPGIFGAGDAFWVNGKQIAHFGDEDALELRLTRRGISARRTALKAESRVTLRSGSSDWITVRAGATNDVELVAELAELAAAAHRPAAGTASKPPPEGPALERMRRFH